MNYLRNFEKRVQYAIRCKRIFGKYIPMTGDINEGDKSLTQKRNKLINYRVDGKSTSTSLNNMLISVKTSSHRIDTLKIYGTSYRGSVDRRRYMTARKILNRLGYLEERSDNWENQQKFDVKYHDAHLSIWRTTKEISWPSGITLSAGTQVFYDGNGEFYTGSQMAIRLYPKDVLKAKVIKITNHP